MIFKNFPLSNRFFSKLIRSKQNVWRCKTRDFWFRTTVSEKHTASCDCWIFPPGMKQNVLVVSAARHSERVLSELFSFSAAAFQPWIDFVDFFTLNIKTVFTVNESDPERDYDGWLARLLKVRLLTTKSGFSNWLTYYYVKETHDWCCSPLWEACNSLLMWPCSKRRKEKTLTASASTQTSASSRCTSVMTSWCPVKRWNSERWQQRPLWKETSSVWSGCFASGCRDRSQESHSVTHCWKWDATKTKADADGTEKNVMAESSEPNSAAERVVWTPSNLKSHVWKYFRFWSVDGKNVVPQDKVVCKLCKLHLA